MKYILNMEIFNNTELKEFEKSDENQSDDKNTAN